MGIQEATRVYESKLVFVTDSSKGAFYCRHSNIAR